MRRLRALSLIAFVCLLVLATASGADIPTAPVVELPKNKAPLGGPAAQPGLYVRIVLDSLYCVKESKWDHATSQDEPYVMTLGIATHRDPGSWSTGRPEVFKDVDSGNNRRFTKPQRVVFEGEVPKGSLIGFEAVLWEKDASSDNAVMKLADSMAHSITDWIDSDDHDLKKEMPRLMAALWPMLISGGVYIVGGGADDKVAEQQALFGYDELIAAATRHRHVGHRMVFKGGKEGEYWLRYHIEFGEDATREFAVKFTGWDDMAVGNVDRVAGEEIVMVCDDDGQGELGRFYVYSGDGRLVRSFDAPFSPGDRIAVADTNGDGMAEILVATCAKGGMVAAYDFMGKQRDRYSIMFAKYDGFAAGDISGDGKAEIVVARVSDRKVHTYSGANGQVIDKFALNWPFKGTRYTSKETRHDALLVGDVIGDGKAEIVMIENRNSNESVIRVYNQRGSEVTNSATAGAFGATFTHGDAAALGDIYGDGKKELILATSEDEKSYSYTTTIADLATRRAVGRRYWPWYRTYAGFAAGAVVPSAKAQIVVANGPDGKLYIGR